MTNYHLIITSRCQKDSTAIKFPERLRHEAGLKTGDHITISITDGMMTITKDLQCRVCHKYTNQLFSKSVMAADDNQYYSLPHCSACGDIPDYSKKRDIILGLVLEGEDAREFWEDRKNPKVTKEQILMFKEAKRIYKTQFRD